MATNYIQPGNVLTIPAPAPAASGAVVIAGRIVGIAAGGADAGEPLDVAVMGVFRLPKVAADAVALGGAVYWNSADGLATVTASDNTPIGVAVEAAPASAGTVAVRLGTI